MCADAAMLMKLNEEDETTSSPEPKPTNLSHEAIRKSIRNANDPTSASIDGLIAGFVTTFNLGGKGVRRRRRSDSDQEFLCNKPV